MGSVFSESLCALHVEADSAADDGEDEDEAEVAQDGDEEGGVEDHGRTEGVRVVGVLRLRPQVREDLQD